MFKKAATELLSLKTDNVQSVLLGTVHGKSEEITKCLNLFPYFNGWSGKSVRECCILSAIKRFLPDTIIVDGTDKNHSYTYFVIDGTCAVVQKIVLQLKISFNGKRIFKMHSDQSITDDSLPDTEIIFVIVRNFVRGDCFGLGEDLPNRWIISSTGVRCLVIPKDFLLQRNQNNVWPRARHRINSSFPTNGQIYESLNRQVKWCRFKKEYADRLRKRKNIVTATRSDIPLYWKINVDVPESLL